MTWKARFWTLQSSVPECSSGDSQSAACVPQTQVHVVLLRPSNTHACGKYVSLHIQRILGSWALGARSKARLIPLDPETM